VMMMISQAVFIVASTMGGLKYVTCCQGISQ
jgi:hypothetical protein